MWCNWMMEIDKKGLHQRFSEGFELCPACPEDEIDEPKTQFFGEFCPTIGNKFRIIISVFT